MGRNETMARFDEEIPENKAVTECISCTEEIFIGQHIIKHEGEIFCGIPCYLEYMDIKTTIITEE